MEEKFKFNIMNGIFDSQVLVSLYLKKIRNKNLKIRYMKYLIYSSLFSYYNILNKTKSLRGNRILYRNKSLIIKREGNS